MKGKQKTKEYGNKNMMEMKEERERKGKQEKKERKRVHE